MRGEIKGKTKSIIGRAAVKQFILGGIGLTQCIDSTSHFVDTQTLLCLSFQFCSPFAFLPLPPAR